MHIRCTYRQVRRAHTSLGLIASARTLFLWYVSVCIVLPVRMSQVRIVLSWLPVMTCKHQKLLHIATPIASTYSYNVSDMMQAFLSLHTSHAVGMDVSCTQLQVAVSVRQLDGTSYLWVCAMAKNGSDCGFVA